MSGRPHVRTLAGLEVCRVSGGLLSPRAQAPEIRIRLEINASSKTYGRSRKFRIFIGTDEGRRYLQALQISVTITALWILHQDALSRGVPALGGVCLTGPGERLGLKNDYASVLQVRRASGVRWRGETLVFIYGIFLSTQGVNEWRRLRHETNPNL
jgi:hypothetical protein